MTDQTPPSADEQLPQVGWWCWRGDNHGHLATEPCRSDNVPIHVPAEWADEMRAVIQQIEDGDEDEPAVPSVSAVDQTTRDRIAAAIRAAACPGADCPLSEEECAERRIQPGAWERGVLSEVYGRPEQFADAVLAVLPPTVDRADVLRDTADVYDSLLADMGADTAKDPRYWTGVQHVVIGLRRLADEAESAAEYSRVLATPPSAEASAYLRERLTSRLADEAQQPAVGARQPDTETPGLHAQYLEAARGALQRHAQADGTEAAEFIAAAMLDARDRAMEQLRRERDLAIAHDRQPYPTAWAYEQACKALHRKTDALDRVEQLALTFEVSGNEFIATQIRAAVTGPAAVVSAAGAGQDETQEADRVVAYRLGGSRTLRCIGCTPSPRGNIWEPVTSEDLTDGGLCSKCDVDVLIEQEAGRG